MADEEPQGPTPPYASWTTVLHLIERMEHEGVPSRIDKTYLVGMAGGTQNQVRHALRSLGLTTQDDRATDMLDDLARQPDSRPQLVADLLRARFPKLTELGLNATRGELDEILGEYGLNGATARKAASFYVSAAMYAGMPLSPYVKPTRGPSSSGTRRTGTRPKRKPANGAEAPRTTETSTSDMKRVYFELLVDKAKSSDQVDTDLLDRIERLVGMVPAPEPLAGPGQGGRS